MKVKARVRKISASHTYIDLYINGTKTGRLFLANKEFATLCDIFAIAKKWVPGFEFHSENKIFERRTAWQPTAVAES